MIRGQQVYTSPKKSVSSVQSVVFYLSPTSCLSEASTLKLRYLRSTEANGFTKQHIDFVELKVHVLFQPPCLILWNGVVGHNLDVYLLDGFLQSLAGLQQEAAAVDEVGADIFGIAN